MVSVCEYVLEYIRRAGGFWTGVFLQHVLEFWGEYSSVRSPTYFGQKPLSLRSEAPPLEYKGMRLFVACLIVKRRGAATPQATEYSPDAAGP